MRITLFILFFYIAFISQAFSDASLKPSHYKGELSPVPAKGVFKQDWTGIYSGLILGYQFGNSSDKTGSFGYNADNNKWNYNEAGYNAGAELGYSLPFHQLIVGPEIELGYLNMKGSRAQPVSPGSDTVGKSSSDFYTAFRARVGVDVNHYLIFATGGAIGVDYTTQVVDSCNMAPCGGSTIKAKKESFVWGYTVGAGVEHLLQKGWSVKLESLYVNLNKQNFNGMTNLGNTYTWSGQTSGYIIRGGLNYYFS